MERSKSSLTRSFGSFARSGWLAAAALAVLAACSRHADEAKAAAPVAPSSASSGTTAAASPAEIGAKAPDFALKDLDGHEVHLADLRGKTVVLEWFNPKCPFVNMAHTKGSLKNAAARHVGEGIVWLGVDSAAPGKQGHDPADIRDAVGRFGLSHPVLLDENGTVGRAYGATNTPHMFVIDKAGVLVYAGAIDNSPDGEGQSPQGGTLVNYVDAALSDLAAGRPVQVSRTKAYGCGVKYGA
jgi:peroxiredoxin